MSEENHIFKQPAGINSLKWVVSINVGLYLIDILVNCLFDLFDPEAKFSLSDFLLGSARDWGMFLRVRLFTLGLSIIAVIALLLLNNRSVAKRRKE